MRLLTSAVAESSGVRMKPQALSPWPKTLSPWPKTLSPGPKTLSPWPKTLSPWPKTLSPWPKILSPWPKTRATTCGFRVQGSKYFTKDCPRSEGGHDCDCDTSADIMTTGLAPRHPTLPVAIWKQA